MTLPIYHAVGGNLVRKGRPNESVPTPPGMRFPGDPGKNPSRTYWGCSVDGAAVQTVAQKEAQGGATMGIHRQYLTSGSTPSAITPPGGTMFNWIAADHANNRIPLISFRYDYTDWQAAGNGEHDTAWDNMIAYIEKTYTKPVWLILNHECDNDFPSGSTQAQKDSWCTTYAPYFRSMIGRLVARRDAYGNANGGIKRLALGNCLTEVPFYSSPGANRAAINWWVSGLDFVGADTYGWNSSTDILTTTHWQNMLSFTAAQNVPYVIPEWGYQQNDPQAKAKMQSFLNTNTDGSHDCAGMTYFDCGPGGGTQWILSDAVSLNNGNTLSYFDSTLANTAKVLHASDLGYT